MGPGEDWRCRGQEKYLKGVDLYWKKYTRYKEGWDHDHCEFCNVKFQETEGLDILNEGYATKDNYHWVCKQCFNDFHEKFGWKTNNVV